MIETKWILGCMCRHITSRDRDVIIQLSVRPLMVYCVQFWSPQFKSALTDDSIYIQYIWVLYLWILKFKYMKSWSFSGVLLKPMQKIHVVL